MENVCKNMDKFQMLLEAAALFKEDKDDRSEVPVFETPSVGRYEEVGNSSWQNASTSFRDVITSTPKVPLSRPDYVALDLSQTLMDMEEEPLDLSMSSDTGNAINLVLVKPEPSAPVETTVFHRPLNLVAGDKLQAYSQPPTAEPTAPELDRCTSLAEEKVPQEYSSKGQIAPKAEPLGRGDHDRELLTPPNALQVNDEDVDILRDPVDIAKLQKKLLCGDDADVRNALYTEQVTPAKAPAITPTSEKVPDRNNTVMDLTVGDAVTDYRADSSIGTSKENQKEQGEGNDGNDDDAAENVNGNAALLNEFSICEYFQPYLNFSIFEEDYDDVAEDEEIEADSNAKPDDQRITRSRKSLAAVAPQESPLEKTDNIYVHRGEEPGLVSAGCNELEKENVYRRKKDTGHRIIVKNKILKTRGMQYQRRDGSTVPARKIKRSCQCAKLQCNKKFNDEIRKKFLENFLKLTSSAQNQFLANHITVGHVKQHTVFDSRREVTRTYFMPGVGGKVKVCKQMFLSTFDIKAKKIRVIASKLIEGAGIVSEDQRLLNRNHNSITEAEKNRIEAHILSFPSCTSHYMREKSSKLFLSSDLSVKKMHELYVQQCKENGNPSIHYNSYRMIFNTFNLAFRKPKVDTCNTCDILATEFKVAADEEKENVRAKLDHHQKKAQIMYDEKRNDIEASTTDHTVRVASFDLQKCLPTPFLKCGQAFYRRQLYTLNLTVFESCHGENKAVCFLWNEAIARRGAQEIGSCLIEDVHSVLGAKPEITKLVYYSDRCSGQNHNFIICMMFLHIIDLCRRDGRELTISHKFMVSGHSHMQVDSVHGAIERAKKRTTMDIETPRDWAVFISQIRRKIPINVIELNQSQFLTLKGLEARFHRPKLNLSGRPVKLRDILWFEYRTSSPGTVFYKENVHDDFDSFIAIKNGAANLDDVELGPINTTPIELSQEKLEDLRSLLPFVTNKQYYETLLKSLVAPKRGRKKQKKKDDHFDDDLDVFEDEL